MALYIRLYTSFWTHRKTIKLQSIIGNEALWIMPKLWSYAAVHQEDGDFSKYSAKEIALLVAHLGDPQALLQALLQAGFMDEGNKLHDWHEHNGYHARYRERAKNAAAASKAIRDERKGKETSLACSLACSSSDGFVDFWKMYPRKVAKPDAVRAWSKQKPPIKECMEALERHKRLPDWIKDGGSYIPYPASWLNARRWEDEQMALPSKSVGGLVNGCVPNAV